LKNDIAACFVCRKIIPRDEVFFLHPDGTSFCDYCSDKLGVRDRFEKELGARNESLF